MPAEKGLHISDGVCGRGVSWVGQNQVGKQKKRKCKANSPRLSTGHINHLQAKEDGAARKIVCMGKKKGVRGQLNTKWITKHPGGILQTGTGALKRREGLEKRS